MKSIVFSFILGEKIREEEIICTKPHSVGAEIFDLGRTGNHVRGCQPLPKSNQGKIDYINLRGARKYKEIKAEDLG